MPKAGLHAAIEAFPNKNVTIKLNEVDHNTFQENITTYLQNPDDVIPWFAGYRMQYFAAQDLLGPIDDVWEAGLNDTMSEGFKLASTGQDGKLYFVPWTYYCWGIHYRPSVFEENGWTPPTTYGRAEDAGEEHAGRGHRPVRVRQRRPVAGDGHVRPAQLPHERLPVPHGPDGRQGELDRRPREERLHGVGEAPAVPPGEPQRPQMARGRQPPSSNKEAGMMTIGNFVGQQFPEGDTSDLDFFPWPEMNPEFGTDTIEAPIDGWMMAKAPKNPDAAKELLYYFGTADAQEAYLSKDPSVIGAALTSTSRSTPRCSRRSLEAVSAAPTVTQFLDRDTSPEFASNVAGQAFADFLADPSSIDSILEDMQAQAEAIFGGVTPTAPADAQRRAPFTLAAKRGQHWQPQPRSRIRPRSIRWPSAKVAPSPAVRRTRPLGRAGDGRDPDDPARRAGLDPDDRLDLALVHGLEGDPVQRHHTGSGSRTTSRSSRSSRRTSSRR